MTESLSPAVFVDRDGTIIQNVDYCSDPHQVKIFAGVPEALKRLKSKGFKLIIVTNQSGIGRGLLNIGQYRAVEEEVLRQLGPELIDATYFCPDVPGQHSTFRKPAPGMITAATRENQIDLGRSFLIGDKEIDVECGRNAGVRTTRRRSRPARPRRRSTRSSRNHPKQNAMTTRSSPKEARDSTFSFMPPKH